MLRVLTSLFSFIEIFFFWLPPYLSTFVTTVCSALVLVFIILLAVKVISIGVDILKGFT